MAAWPACEDVSEHRAAEAMLRLALGGWPVPSEEEFGAGAAGRDNCCPIRA